MSGEEDTNFWLSPDEILITAEELSVMSVEVGLRNADLRPLAEHLRQDYSIPVEIAEMIADAIDGMPASECQIRATRQTAGNPHNSNGALHTRNLKIGFEYLREIRVAKRGYAQRVKSNIAQRLSVSESTVRDAVSYTRRWLEGLVEGSGQENDQ